jgi:hypothetical protein
MRYLDKYPECHGCPVYKYCGTMVSSSRLYNSYEQDTQRPEEKQEVG